jgi:hypothetical protein
MIRLNTLLNEGTITEGNPILNKKVKMLLDKELNDLSKGRPNHQWAVMHILKGALTDANFHSVSKKVPSLFPKADYDGDPMAEKDLIEIYEYEIGPKIANICKWDGKDIVDAIGFYVSMTIGRPMGEKIEKLVESIKEEAQVNEENPCWKGYEQIGMKNKGGKQVPNCVPKNESIKLTNNLPFKISKVNTTETKLKENTPDTYFKSFTDAASAAKAYAVKKGYEINEDDWQTQVALGGKYSRSRPGVGKTHSFSVGLLRNGKPQRKGLNFSVYGMESGKYELTAYVN